MHRRGALNHVIGCGKLSREGGFCVWGVVFLMKSKLSLEEERKPGGQSDAIQVLEV